MKLQHKLLALAVMGLAAAAPAQANIADSSTGNGELFMTVLDSVGQKSYTLDLNITMDSFLSGIAVAGAQYTYTADSLMSSFLNGVALANKPGLTWAIGALDGIGTTTTEIARIITTSKDIDVNGAKVSNTALKGFNSVDTFLGDTNGFIGANNSVIINDPVASAYAGSASWGNKWAGKANFTSTSVIGETTSMYLLSQSSGAFAARNNASIYAATLQGTNQVYGTLDTSGNLTIGVAAVPEADTWAMFAAGLLAVGAIARRRMAA